jgi:hypothetical protein
MIPREELYQLVLGGADDEGRSPLRRIRKLSRPGLRKIMSAARSAITIVGRMLADHQLALMVEQPVEGIVRLVAAR